MTDIFTNHWVVLAALAALIIAALGTFLNRRVVPSDNQGLRRFQKAWFLSFCGLHIRVSRLSDAGMKPRPIHSR